MYNYIPMTQPESSEAKQPEDNIDPSADALELVTRGIESIPGVEVEVIEEESPETTSEPQAYDEEIA